MSKQSLDQNILKFCFTLQKTGLQGMASSELYHSRNWLMWALIWNEMYFDLLMHSYTKIIFPISSCIIIVKLMGHIRLRRKIVLCVFISIGIFNSRWCWLWCIKIYFDIKVVFLLSSSSCHIFWTVSILDISFLEIHPETPQLVMIMGSQRIIKKIVLQ